LARSEKEAYPIEKRPVGHNPIGRFENWHGNIQGCFRRYGNNNMDMLLLCCLLAKPGRYVSIAAICIDRKGNNKTRRYPPIMPPCPVKRRTLLSFPKNGKRRFFKTAVRYVHWAYITTRRNNGFFYNRLTAGTPSSYSFSANFGPSWPEVTGLHHLWRQRRTNLNL